MTRTLRNYSGDVIPTVPDRSERRVILQTSRGDSPINDSSPDRAINRA